VEVGTMGFGLFQPGGAPWRALSEQKWVGTVVLGGAAGWRW
jgi:hypothetical protein